MTHVEKMTLGRSGENPDAKLLKRSASPSVPLNWVSRFDADYDVKLIKARLAKCL
jgi:hypothetical protein